MTNESNLQSLPAQPPRGSSRQPAEFAEAMADPSAFHEAGRFRADTYGLLARLFRAAPDRELIDLLSGNQLPPQFDFIDDNAPDTGLARAWTGLSEAAGNADPATLDDEFHALFIGLGRGEVLPYASWYLSGFLLDKPLARLRADLNTLGIERADSVTEPEDHFAALCETMALLVDEEEGVDHATQKQFFDRHLQPWFPRFLADVKAARSADFYRGVADLGQAFFEFEESWLSLPQ